MSWHCDPRWVAGFFDGEGCVSIVRRQRGGFIEHMIAIQIGQKDRRPLDAIRDKYGGSICPTKTPSGCWRWRCHGKTAERFMRAIVLHCKLKRRELELALTLRQLIGRPGHRMSPDTFRRKDRVWHEFRRVKERR